ncbi:MAG TPA: NUDIX domain-containing protein, partial [Longimicrobiales bacterium]|nr:NUDIX domain-containing protein [Longimicrobiales bacterium]
MDSPNADRHREVGGDPDALLPTALVARVRDALLAFFDAHARDLPWRRTGDPYRIWVSEVMLQQTRVETVVPYYRRWMERFPDVDRLAEADLDDVLKAWEGLGYYRRARMLHQAARMIRERGGGLPDTAKGLRRLPGIGDYTAGAVASIAFGRPEPAVDGNVRRVLSRLFDLAEPGPAELRRRARTLLPPDRPGDLNQALMEVGATVCTVRAPGCDGCPIAPDCRARARGVQERRPLPRRRAPPARAEFGVAVPVREDREAGTWSVALARRPVDGMLGGLWELPGEEIAGGEDPAAAARRAAVARGIPVGPPERELPVVDHAYSHLLARYRPYLF